MSFEAISDWFYSLGENYGVNPLIFGVIYVGAIPFFSLSIAWLVKNYRQKKSIVLPAVVGNVFLYFGLYLSDFRRKKCSRLGLRIRDFVIGFRCVFDDQKNQKSDKGKIKNYQLSIINYQLFFSY